MPELNEYIEGKGYIFDYPPKETYLAELFFDLLVAAGVLQICDAQLKIVYTEKGQQLIELLERTGIWEDDREYIDVAICVMLFCGEITIGPDGALHKGPAFYTNCNLQCELTEAAPNIPGNKPITASKTWVLISPSGEHIEVQNLSSWLAENIMLFGYDDPSNSVVVSKRFRELARFMRKGSSRRTTYKGWKLAKLPY